MDKTETDEQKLYRIEWVSGLTRHRGNGNWLDKSLCEAHLEHARSEYPYILHWMNEKREPVPDIYTEEEKAQQSEIIDAWIDRCLDGDYVTIEDFDSEDRLGEIRRIAQARRG